VPQIQQVQWYLGYDDKFIYLAMRSPHPEGIYPVARVKEDALVSGAPAVLFEDLAGRDLVIQLVRTDSCTGMCFAGWVGAPWMAWDRFARVDFRPDARSGSQGGTNEGMRNEGMRNEE
jgi:hypothetical protein